MPLLWALSKSETDFCRSDTTNKINKTHRILNIIYISNYTCHFLKYSSLERVLNIDTSYYHSYRLNFCLNGFRYNHIFLNVFVSLSREIYISQVVYILVQVVGQRCYMHTHAYQLAMFQSAFQDRYLHVIHQYEGFVNKSYVLSSIDPVDLSSKLADLILPHVSLIASSFVGGVSTQVHYTMEMAEVYSLPQVPPY